MGIVSPLKVGQSCRSALISRSEGNELEARADKNIGSLVFEDLGGAAASAPRWWLCQDASPTAGRHALLVENPTEPFTFLHVSASDQ